MWDGLLMTSKQKIIIGTLKIQQVLRITNRISTNLNLFLSFYQLKYLINHFY